jgi:hypothetical protein
MSLSFGELTGGTFEAGRRLLVRVLQRMIQEDFKGGGKGEYWQELRE